MQIELVKWINQERDALYELCRPAMLICLVMLVPILPFLAFGPQITEWFSEWSEQENAAVLTSGVIVGLLSIDILLPIPSSMISTFGGVELGKLCLESAINK